MSEETKTEEKKTNGNGVEVPPKYARNKLTPSQIALLQKAINSATRDENLLKVFPMEMAFFRSIFQKTDFFFVVYHTTVKSRSKYRG